MGKNSGKANTTATPATQAAAVANVPTKTFGAFMPEGVQGLLANQLATGGFGTPEQLNGLLAGINSPVTLPLISTPDQIAGYLKQTGKDTAPSTDASQSGNGLKIPVYDRSSGRQYTIDANKLVR